MSASTRSYTQANTGNLNEYLSNKIKDAARMAAEERRIAKNEEKFQRESGVPEDEITKYDKGYFFGKSLAHEFGGDLFRRTKGRMSSDPSEENDPALNKRQRFSALIRGDKPVLQPMKQLELPLEQGKDPNAVEVEDKSLKSWLSVLFNQIEKSNNALVKKIDSNKKDGGVLGSSDDGKEDNSLKKIFSVVQTIKDYFNKNNDLKKEEINLKEQQLEFQFDAQNKQEMSVKESNLESGQDVSQTQGYVDPYTGKSLDGETDTNEDSGDGTTDQPPEASQEEPKKGGFLQNITSFLRNRGGQNTGGGSPPMPPPPMKMSEGGIISPTPSTNLIQNSSNVVSNTKIIPNPVTSSGRATKMAAGGIVSNPTRTTIPDKGGVIPLNRNNPIKNLITQMNINNKMPGATNKPTSSGKDMPKILNETMQLVTQAGGGLLLTVMSTVFKKLGAIGEFVKPFVLNLASSLPRAFGLPATIIGGLFSGAPAAAATLDMKGFADFLKGDGKKGGKKKGASSGGSNPPSPPPGGGGADLGASMRQGEVIQAQGANEAGGFIQGGSGLGSEGGQNTNQGYATHWHLSPPSNDPAGWAEARAVAFTSAKMMLARGSSIYFGNLKQNAVKGDDAKLQQQIAAEQQAHTQPNRTQGGIDMQEKSPTGNMALKFPLKVTNVTQDINGGSGRTARVIGTNVRLAHGAAGSANSVESAASPAVASTPPSMRPAGGNNGNASSMSRPASMPTPTTTYAGLTLPNTAQPQAIVIPQSSSPKIAPPKFGGQGTSLSVFDVNNPYFNTLW